MRLALLRGLPLVEEFPVHDNTAVLVGSGPSVKDYLDDIRECRKNGEVIVAIKSAHDWLMENGIVPGYAVAVEPQAKHELWFSKKNSETRYLIASQCNPATFDYLSDCQVYLWHLYIEEGQTYPPNSILVTGGTTSGLRAINLFHALGFRKFKLYGYDSCLQDGQLRVGGTDNGDPAVEVICGGESFMTTPPMAAQASEFQNLFTAMPDIEIESHGRGIITKILEERLKLARTNGDNTTH